MYVVTLLLALCVSGLSSLPLVVRQPAEKVATDTSSLINAVDVFDDPEFNTALVYDMLRSGDSDAWEMYGESIEEAIDNLLSSGNARNVREALVRVLYPEITDEEVSDLVAKTDAAFIDYVNSLPEEEASEDQQDGNDEDDANTLEELSYVSSSGPFVRQLKKLVPAENGDDEAEVELFLQSLRLTPPQGSEAATTLATPPSVQPTTSTVTTSSPAPQKRGQDEVPLYLSRHEKDRRD